MRVILGNPEYALPLGSPWGPFGFPLPPSGHPLALFWSPRGPPSIRFGLHEFSVNRHYLPSVFLDLTPRFVEHPFAPKP